MNTANKLTILRVFMIPVFLLVLYLDVPNANYWALAIFVIASLTDTLDGYIARHYNQTTDFGKFMDPLADKCLVTAAMLWFVEIGQMPAWALLVVIIREFGVSGLLRRGVFCQKPGRDLGNQVKVFRQGRINGPALFRTKISEIVQPFPPESRVISKEKKEARVWNGRRRSGWWPSTAPRCTAWPTPARGAGRMRRT